MPQNFLRISSRNTEDIREPILQVTIRLRILCTFWKQQFSTEIERDWNSLLLYLFLLYEPKFYQKY